MLRVVPRTVSRVGRSYEHFPDGFELHLLLAGAQQGGAPRREVGLIQRKLAALSGRALRDLVGTVG